MSDKSTHSSGAEELVPGSNNAGALTRGAWAKKLKDEEERDLGQVKGDDGNIDRGLQLTSGGYQQIGDSSILRGESRAPLEASILQGESQAPTEASIRQGESRSMVSTPLSVLTPDGSLSHVLQVEEQVAEDEAVGDEDLSHQPDDGHSPDWSFLPSELVISLFKNYFKPGDVLASSQTCQRWRILGEDDKLWEHKCDQAGLANSLTPANRRSLERRSKDTNFAYSAWKENFLKPYKIARKFREGNPQVINTEISYYVRCLEFFNDKIVTTRGKNINVFCALSGELLYELVEHTDSMIAIQMDDLVIVSGSYDGSVKVWDVETGSCLHTLLDHTDEVTCLSMHGPIAVSGSLNGTLRVWNVREGNCIKTLTGHTHCVLNVQFDGRLVVSCSHGWMIKVWDPDTGECLRTLSHNSSISCLKFNGVAVVAGYLDRSIKVWDVDTGICRHTLEENVSECVMELQSDVLVCGGADATTAKIWNVTTGACLHTLAGVNKHSGRITSIQRNKKFVVTSSVDGRVKLWDLKTGEFVRDMPLESGARVLEMRMNEAKIMCVVECRGRFKLLVLNFDTNEEN